MECASERKERTVDSSKLKVKRSEASARTIWDEQASLPPGVCGSMSKEIGCGSTCPHRRENKQDRKSLFCFTCEGVQPRGECSKLSRPYMREYITVSTCCQVVSGLGWKLGVTFDGTQDPPFGNQGWGTLRIS